MFGLMIHKIVRNLQPGGKGPGNAFATCGMRNELIVIFFANWISIRISSACVLIHRYAATNCKLYSVYHNPPPPRRSSLSAALLAAISAILVECNLAKTVS